MISVHDTKPVGALGELSRFRQEFYRSEQRVTGPASDFCLLVTGRRGPGRPRADRRRLRGRPLAGHRTGIPGTAGHGRAPAQFDKPQK